MQEWFNVTRAFCTYLLLYSFNPSTWGHSPKDIEHVKNSCNIYKAKYIQCMKNKNNQKVYVAKKIHANFKIENTYKINSDIYQPKL
jgi:hypothetical protein